MADGRQHHGRLRWLPTIAAVIGLVLAVSACGTIPSSSTGSRPTATGVPNASAPGFDESDRPVPRPPHSSSTGPSHAPSSTGAPSSKHSENRSSSRPDDGVVVTPAATVQRCLAAPHRSECPRTPTVYLTIDDGPSAASTSDYLAMLRQRKVAATFFVTGQQVVGNPDLTRQIVKQGSTIGIHSWSHDYDRLYPNRVADAKQIGAEVDRTLDALRDALGPTYATTAFRYPGGHMSWEEMEPADRALADRGMAWVDWNSMYGDAEPAGRRPTTVRAMVKMATSMATRSGNHTVVVLLHDGPTRGLSRKATPKVIAWFAAHGYRFGIIS